MSVNKVILIGNVGRDPEVRYLENGVAVAQFTMATTERGYTSSNGTQVPDRTEWHNIVLWRGLAEVAEKYVRKGSQIYIEGKITTRSYDDAQGAKRYVTEIIAQNMTLLGGRRDNNDGQHAPAPSMNQAPAQNAQPAANPYQTAQPQQATNYNQNQGSASSAINEGGSTDDLPF